MNLTIRFDSSRNNDLFRRLFALAEAGECPLEVVDLFLNRPQALFELRAIQPDDSLTRDAGEIVVGLYPTDLLLRLMPAAWAGDVDLGFIEKSCGHSSSPCAPCAGLKEDGSGAAGHPHHSASNCALVQRPP